MNYVIPQEYGSFRLAVRSGLTLAGTDPVTGLIAAPGGGMKARDKCLTHTVDREGNQEHGPHLTFLPGSPLALYHYVDIRKRKVVTAQEALHSEGVKLHKWILSVETSGLAPQEPRPHEFSEVGFFPPEYFYNSSKLRPSFASAIKHYQGMMLWPKVSIPGELLKPNLENEFLQLTQLLLHPELIESLVPHCAAA